MALPAPLVLALALLAPLPQVLHLADALALARRSQPQLRAAQASVNTAAAQVTEGRAPLLPQLSGGATYSKSTANFVLSPGALPSSASGAGHEAESATLHDFWALSLGAQQLVYDFQQTPRLFAAAVATERQARAQADSTALQVDLAVRQAFFTARAQMALVRVADETLQNQRCHCEQVVGYIRAGQRAEIDLAQSRTNVANARVGRINAANAYDVARAQLNVAIGVEAGIGYDIADEPQPALAVEATPTEALIAQALAGRPDLVALDQGIAAQQSRLGAARSNYFPALSLGLSGTERGPSLQRLTWNYTVSATLSWALFAGGAGLGAEDAAIAGLQQQIAQRDALRQQVRLGVQTAALQVAAGREALAAAGEALANARLLLSYAEGRYRTGVGSIIELSDAQLALTSALTQEVQSELTLAAARALLLETLGLS